MKGELLKLFKENNNWLHLLLLKNQNKLTYAKTLFKFEASKESNIGYINFQFISYIFNLLDNITLNFIPKNIINLTPFLLYSNQQFNNDLTSYYDYIDINFFIENSCTYLEQQTFIGKSKDYFEQKACIHELILLYIKIKFMFIEIPNITLNLVHQLQQMKTIKTTQVNVNSFTYQIFNKYVKHDKKNVSNIIILWIIRNQLNSIIMSNNSVTTTISKDFENFLKNTILLPVLTNMRVDYVSSGLQIINIALNEKDNKSALIFAGVQKPSHDDTEISYISIINKLKTNFNDIDNKENWKIAVNNFLSNFNDNSLILTSIHNFIFSKATVKDIVMLIAYSGTFRGFNDDFYMKFKTYINHNLILLDDKCYKDFAIMRNLLIKKIYNIVIETYAGLKYFSDWTKEIGKIIKMSKSDGFIFEASHITYLLSPKRFKTLQIRTNKLNNITSKVERKSRHNISFFTNILDSNKLMNAIGANIAQTLDASIAFFFRETLLIFSTNDIRIATLFDAFLFSQDFITDSSSNLPFVKDLLRLSTYLTFKQNVLDNIIIKNNIINKNIQRKKSMKNFKTHFSNLFSEIQPKDFIFENVFTSKLYRYILINRNLWFTKDNKPNKQFFANALNNHGSKNEKSEYHTFVINTINSENMIKIPYNIEDFNPNDKALSYLNMDLVTHFITEKVQFILEDFRSNILDETNNDSLIKKLKIILSNDDFVKF